MINSILHPWLVHCFNYKNLLLQILCLKYNFDILWYCMFNFIIVHIFVPLLMSNSIEVKYITKYNLCLWILFPTVLVVLHGHVISFHICTNYHNFLRLQTHFRSFIYLSLHICRSNLACIVSLWIVQPLEVLPSSIAFLDIRSPHHSTNKFFPKFYNYCRQCLVPYKLLLYPKHFWHGILQFFMERETMLHHSIIVILFLLHFLFQHFLFHSIELQTWSSCLCRFWVTMFVPILPFFFGKCVLQIEILTTVILLIYES
jgi:hypothetical protein